MKSKIDQNQILNSFITNITDMHFLGSKVIFISATFVPNQQIFFSFWLIALFTGKLDMVGLEPGTLRHPNDFLIWFQYKFVDDYIWNGLGPLGT